LIPEYRMSLSVRGGSRHGKSTFTGALVKAIWKLGQFKKASMYLYGMKAEDTVPKYPSFVEVRKCYLTMPAVKSKHDEIIIVEDSPRLPKLTRLSWEKTITMMAGANRLFCIDVSQVKRKNCTAIVNAIIERRGGIFNYKMIIDKNESPWYEFTNRSEVDVSKALDVLENGISERITQSFRFGRRSRSDSEYHKCFTWFDSGGSPKDYCLKMGYKSQTKEYVRVYAYYGRWQRLKG